jgi:TolA-binding protein
VRRASGDVGVGADTAIPAETLSREIAIIDRARGLLTAGRAAEVMAVLDDYEHRFSQRHFAPEAHYLRLEALLLAGRAAEARALAQRLLASYPTSPQSEKARQLLAR